MAKRTKVEPLGGGFRYHTLGEVIDGLPTAENHPDQTLKIATRLVPLELIDTIDAFMRKPAKQEKAIVARLAESMRAKDQLVPIILHDLKDGRYGLSDGVRRVKAAKLLGWTHVRAEIRGNLAVNDVERLRECVNGGWRKNGLEADHDE